jgi:predicted O-methyltransferase YrrM
MAQIAADFDFIFVDGDHSVEGITRDWKDWAPRVRPGGLIALHDTEVASANPHVASLGSFWFFQNVIRFDSRFETLEQVDTLSILRRREE